MRLGRFCLTSVLCKIHPIFTPRRCLTWLAPALALFAAAADAQTLRQDFAIPDGEVVATAVNNNTNTLYIGGKFHVVGPPTGSAVAFNSAGQALPSPVVEGSVHAIIPDGAGGWFIGGFFTRIGGVSRSNLARVAADGSVSSWNPGTNFQVNTLLLQGSVLYVGGTFNTIAGVGRSRLAALNATTGAATSWNPGANDDVATLASDGTSLFVGGKFTSIGGQTRNRVAAFDLGTGNLVAWNPNADGEVLTLAVRPGGASVYAGGLFTTIGGLARSRIAELDASGGAATAWDASCSCTTVDALAVTATRVYVGGLYNSIGGAPIANLAALDPFSGVALGWEPDPNDRVRSLAVSGNTVYAGGEFTSAGGAARYRVAALDAAIAVGNATPWSPPATSDVLALAVQGGTVYVGGSFGSIGGFLRNGIAAIDRLTGAVQSWNPPLSSSLQVHSLAVEPSGSRIYAAYELLLNPGTSDVAALDGGSGASLWTTETNGVVWDLALMGSVLYLGGAFDFVRDPTPPPGPGDPRSRLAALTVATGELTTWNPGANGVVRALEASSDLLYLGGDFTSVAGQTRNHLAALGANGTVAVWNPDADDDVFSLAIRGSVVYIGGAFANVGFQTRAHLAAVGSDGFVFPWAPGPSERVEAILPAGGVVVIGGWFMSVGGETRDGVARVSWQGGQVSNWDPGLNAFPAANINTLAMGTSEFYMGGRFWSIVGGGINRSYLAAYTSPEAWVPDVAMGEGNVNLMPVVVNLLLTTPSVDAVTVNWTTEDGTATVAGNDYVPAGGVVTFLPGQTSATLTVNVVGDQQSEPDETFGVRLFSSSFALIADELGTVTIIDDEPLSVVCGDLPVTDGVVHAMVEADGVLYIGGEFNNVGPGTGGAAPLDPVTGLALGVPRVTGSVFAIAPDGSGGWFIGGQFTHVGGIGRLNLAHLRADHTVSEWTPNANGVVFSLVVSGSVVYVGGDFTGVGGQPRNRIAALDTQSGLATAWNPNANGAVYALAVEGNIVYAGGFFTSIAGNPRSYLAALYPNGGATPWNPSPNNGVFTLSATGGIVYAGGVFTQIAGQPRNRAAALTTALTASATSWNPNAGGMVRALAVGPSAVYLGGSFTTMGGQARFNFAAVDLATGSLTPWLPQNPNNEVHSVMTSGGGVYIGGMFTQVGGVLRSGLAAFDGNGLPTSWNPRATGGPFASVYALASASGVVYAGGSFVLAGAQPRTNLAALDIATGAVRPWNPSAEGGAVRALAMRGGALYAAGDFLAIGGLSRPRLAELDPEEGIPTNWSPEPDFTVKALVVSDDTLYVGGDFTHIGPTIRNRLAAFDAAGALTSWNPNSNGEVRAMVVSGSTMYVGGLFNNIGGQPRDRIAALRRGNGLATAWDPDVSGGCCVNALALDGGVVYVGGDFQLLSNVPRERLGAVNVSNGQATAWNPGATDGPITSLALDGPTLYVGGAFSTIGFVARNFLASLSTTSAQADPWNPSPNGAVYALLLSGGRIYTGGSFTRVGGLPITGVGCAIPLAAVDVPVSSAMHDISFSPIKPNPSEGVCRLEYALPEPGHVRIEVYDIQGRLRARPLDAVRPAGTHSLTWNARSQALSAGVYFIRMKAAGRQLTRSLVLVR